MSGRETKCLVIIVNRGKGEQVAELCRSHQLYFTYGVLALGMANSDLLNYLGIGETDKGLLFCCFPAQPGHEVMHRIAKETQIRKMGRGIMFTTPPSGIGSLFQCKILCERICEGEETKQKERKYELVITVVERDWRNQVMEAAKEANTTGDTVLHTRSLHEDDAISFLGIRLQGGEDIIVVLSVYEDYKQIIHEVSMAAGLQTGARGLIFSTPVDEFIGM